MSPQRPRWRPPAPRVIADACGRALRRTAPQLAAAGIALVVIAAAWLGYHFVTTSDRFAIREIRVEGTERLTAEAVRAQVGVALGDNIFAADPDELSERLRAEPWVAWVTVRRELPSTVRIELREHAAVARARLTGAAMFLINREGYPFMLADQPFEELPLISGLTASDYRRDGAATAATLTAALDLLARWQRAGRPAIREIALDSRRAATFVLADYGTATAGTAVELGALDDGEAVARRMATFDAAWAALASSERERARAIHLDRADRATVALAD